MRHSGSHRRTAIATAAALVCAVGGTSHAQSLTESTPYLADQRVNGAFSLGTLDERGGAFGRQQGRLGFGTDVHNPSSLWLRTSGGAFNADLDRSLGLARPATLVQTGADVASWSLLGSGDRVRLGAMAGQSRASADLLGLGNPVQADGRAIGTSVGAYATWFQNDRSRLGWYADSWGQYNSYRSAANGPLPAGGDYRGSDSLLSLETGYTLRLADGLDWRVTPQGQVVYARNNQGASLAGPSASGLTGDDGWIGRVGVRLTSPAAEAGAWRFQPYAAVNWWHDGLNGTTLLDPATGRGFYPSERYEVKTGLEVLFGPKWSAWGSLGMQWGDQSYKNWSAGIGLRYAM